MSERLYGVVDGGWELLVLLVPTAEVEEGDARVLSKDRARSSCWGGRPPREESVASENMGFLTDSPRLKFNVLDEADCKKKK